VGIPSFEFSSIDSISARVSRSEGYRANINVAMNTLTVLAYWNPFHTIHWATFHHVDVNITHSTCALHIAYYGLLGRVQTFMGFFGEVPVVVVQRTTSVWEPWLTWILCFTWSSSSLHSKSSSLSRLCKQHHMRVFASSFGASRSNWVNIVNTTSWTTSSLPILPHAIHILIFLREAGCYKQIKSSSFGDRGLGFR